MDIPIPVLCDRCGAAGIAGAADFSHLGDLLAFTAVPRQLKRRDGWTPVLQREFIARLAQTASPTLAVEAMGKNLHGIRKLLKDPGSDGFRAAWERAVELGEAAEARRRIAEIAGIHARGAHLAAPSRSRGIEPEPAEPEPEEMDEDGKLALLERLVAKFMAKVGQERECRLAGRIVEADFYLRQVTCLEVAFDLMVGGHGLDAWQEIARVRRGGHGILQIADTGMSRILDAARRAQWEKMGEPARPEHPPERYLADHGDHRTEGTEHTVGGEVSHEEQKREQAARHAKDAEAQVEWEAAARRAYEERRDRDASS